MTLKIVVNGNCINCGKPLSGERLFVCEACESLLSDNIRFDQAAAWNTRAESED